MEVQDNEYDDSEDDQMSGDFEENESNEIEGNPLLVDPEKQTDQDTKTKLWFGKVCSF